jgi:hypothetical protein
MEFYFGSMKDNLAQRLYKNERTYRMYGLVPYNLSPIQQGIQYGHAVVEYANDYFHSTEYEIWANRDKTFIILNGGTTNNKLDDAGIPKGTLNQHEKILQYHGIKLATFNEPDLGDQLTAVVFIVDDRIFDREAWPNYAGKFYEGTIIPDEMEYYEWKMKFSNDEKEADRIVFLRDFLSKFRLA